MSGAASTSVSSAAASLKEYLRRYESSGGADDQKKKKKKKKPKPNPTAGGVLVVDEDPVWQKPVQIEEDDGDDSGEEKPQIDEDIEVKRMKRLEAIRSRKPYDAISEDGSGWIAISDPSKTSSSTAAGPDLSPPRQRRTRLDTPSPGREQEPAGPEDRDLSPPRQCRRRFDTPSPGREREPADPGDRDLSPPRQHRRRFDTPSPSHKQRTFDIEDPGRSPPLPRRRRFDEPSLEPEAGGDLSPPRRRSREGLSPPRRNRRHPPEPAELRDSSSTLLTPPRRSRRESPDDISPPRRTHRRSPDAPKQHGSPAPDLSPPRRSRKGSPGDLSPPRRRRSPEASRTGESPADDLSPPRRSRKGSSGDLSPPRRPCSHEARGTKESPATDLSPPRKRRKEEERKTGLLTAKEVRDEIDKKKKEDLLRFTSMDPSRSGRGAKPVFRDKEGKRISKEEILKAQEEEKPKEKKLEWGKGLAQKREVEAKAQELELEREKPFARSRDDPELDKMLKERIRWGDPMAHLVKRNNSEPVLEDFGDNEKMKESGFIIPQTIPSHSWIKRGLDFPPNRYGIRPGRHWDGVDRSSGYEKEMFKRQNEKRATESEAYLWSVSDM